MRRKKKKKKGSVSWATRTVASLNLSDWPTVCVFAIWLLACSVSQPQTKSPQQVPTEFSQGNPFVPAGRLLLLPCARPNGWPTPHGQIKPQWLLGNLVLASPAPWPALFQVQYLFMNRFNPRRRFDFTLPPHSQPSADLLCKAHLHTGGRSIRALR